MGANRKKFGYVLGPAASAAAAVVTLLLTLYWFQAQAVRCFMSLGCNEGDVSMAAPLLLLGGYLLAAVALAAVARLVFKSGLLVGTLLNVSPLVVMVALLTLWLWYGSFTREARITRSYHAALEDAPAIRLGEPFVKKVAPPNRGVVLLVHVPFHVAREVRPHSLNIMAELEEPARYSPNPYCNSGYNVPTHGFHVVDREYDEPSTPGLAPAAKPVAGPLRPGERYYLLQELHFGGSICTLEDYRDLDAAGFKVRLNTYRIRERLRGAG